MRSRKLYAPAAAAAMVTLGLLIALAWRDASSEASVDQQQSIGVRWQYSAKFLCSGPGWLPLDGAGVVPAEYKTAVNIHNISQSPITFAKKGAIANVEGEAQGSISPRRAVTLPADGAVEVDCADIRSLFPEDMDLTPNGFLVIESPVRLDVVAVYTSLHKQIETRHKLTVRAQWKGEGSWPQPLLDLLSSEGWYAIESSEGWYSIEYIGWVDLDYIGWVDPTSLVESWVQALVDRGMSPEDAEAMVANVDLEVVDPDLGVGTGVGQSLDVEAISPQPVRYEIPLPAPAQ